MNRWSSLAWKRLKCVLVIGIGLSGCTPPLGIPDQSQFEPLESFDGADQAVVRVCGAPIPSLEGIAIHAWFVAKGRDDDAFDRWEVWQNAGGIGVIP